MIGPLIFGSIAGVVLSVAGVDVTKQPVLFLALMFALAIGAQIAKRF